MPCTQALTTWDAKDWELVDTQSKHKIKLLDRVIKSASSVLETFSGSTESVSTSGPTQNLQEEDWVRTIQYCGTYYKNEIESIYPDLVHRLEHIRHLQQNWDTYGSSAPSGLAIYYAYILLNQLRKSAIMRGAELPEPEACPGPKGSIQFDWDVNGREFELKFTVKNKDIRYVFLLCPESNPDTWEEGEFVGLVSEHPSVRSFLAWI